MTEGWIECVPNFSEGRRQEVVEALRETIRGVPGTVVLDVHTDADHNRSVITFAGPAAAVAEAAFVAIARAAQEIDLRNHRGEHPRIGATDVVPFVPLAGSSLEACVDLAHRLGDRVGQELEIPVYFYEAAAKRAGRVNLEDIRRGEYEGLLTSIATDPDRAPDCGPTKLGPAGATVIGARLPLIAYNIYLTTSEVGVAKEIARAVRHSSGGLRFVKALGLDVNGRAQISMNLTDYTRTPLARVVELVRREAHRHGVDILRSELVGLVPERAILDAAAWYLQLDGFEAAQVLEARLAAKREAPQPAGPNFLDRLAAGAPTPGGGSAAATSAAMAAALTAMVARLTIGKKKYAAIESRMAVILEAAEDLRRRLVGLAEDDAAAFEAVLRALRLPKETSEEQAARDQAVEAATLQAARIPLSVALAAADAAELGAEAVEMGNVNTITDAAAALAMAHAAFQAAALNVRINARGLKDPEPARQWEEALANAARRIEAAERRSRAGLKARAQIVDST